MKWLQDFLGNKQKQSSSKNKVTENNPSIIVKESKRDIVRSTSDIALDWFKLYVETPQLKNISDDILIQLMDCWIAGKQKQQLFTGADWGIVREEGIAWLMQERDIATSKGSENQSEFINIHTPMFCQIKQ